HVPGPQGVQPGVPRVVRPGRGARLGRDRVQRPLLPGLAAPVVAELVPGHADQPGRADRRPRPGPDRVHRREERFRGEVLGHRPLPAPGQQVAVDLRQGVIVERQQPRSGTGRRRPARWLLAHTLIVVPAAHAPTGDAGFSVATGPDLVEAHGCRRAALAGYRGHMPDRKEILEVAGRPVVITNPDKVFF